MEQAEYQYHSAADQFPMLDEKRLNELAEDIKINGQREDIKTYQNQILDGRNRYEACKKIGITPRVSPLSKTIDPYLYVWSLNGERRDLAAAQRYGIWKNCMEQSAEWQARQQRIQEEASRKRAEAAEQQERTAIGTFESTMPNKGTENEGEPVTAQPVRSPAKEHSDVSRQSKATASKTNRGTVERMDRLHRKRKDLYDKVIDGTVTEAAAVREMNKAENKAKLEEVSSKEPGKLNYKYDVIVMDPPWPMQKIERDVRPNQSDFDYPTMSENELAALELPAAENCHLFLWTTQKFMPMAFRLIKKWGFRYLCTFVWHKPGGFQPIGLPQYNCEFALYARKGSPDFFDTKQFFTCFEAPRGNHSEKPQEFYDIIKRVTTGRRLDMFNRREIEGFEGWGLESPLNDT